VIGTLAYAVLLIAIVSSVVQRTWAIFVVSALLLPLTKAMPEPLGFVSSPINLMLVGIVLRILGQKPERGARPLSLPMRGPIVFMLLTLLIGLAIRASSDFRGEDHLLPLSAVAKNIWYWCLPLVFYAATFRAAVLGMDIDRLVLAAQGSMVFEALYAVMEQLHGATRSTAHLGEDNLAGSYFASMAGFFLAWSLMEHRMPRWLGFGAFALAMAAVFSTLSRGAMAAAAAAATIVVFVFMVGARKGMSTKLGFALIAIVAVAHLSLFIPESVRSRVLGTFVGTEVAEGTEETVDPSTAERMYYQWAAIRLCQENPLGHGAFIFSELMLHERGKAKVAHNIYLTMFVEFGIQGFVAILVLVLTIYLRLFRAFRRGAGDLQAKLGLALIGWWTGHVIAHVFLNSFFSMLVVGPFWMMLACEEARAAMRQEASSREKVSLAPSLARSAPRPAR
jgi:O-antigen ligase